MKSFLDALAAIVAAWVRRGQPAPVVARPAVADRFAACLPEILKREGGWSDHPADPGGATNYGITLRTFSAFRGEQMSKGDLMAISQDEVAAIYRANYWNAVKGDLLPPGVDLALFDFAVNSGPGRAIRELQAVLGVTADGMIGPKTLDAIKRAGPVTVIVDLCDKRMAFLRSLPTWGTFGKGWTRRVDEVERVALAAAS